jgi:hypothetical protein
MKDTKRHAARIVLATILISVAPVALVLLSAQVRIVRKGENRAPGTPAANNAAPAANVQPIEPTQEERTRIDDLIGQLGAPKLTQRDRAMSELAQFEARALTQIRGAKDHDDDEIASRAVLLEEVILGGQGELFLAARSLNLSIAELNSHLASQDVSPLLAILKSRAQPGMIPLWARVLSRLAGQPRLYPAAELCRQIEGDVGYGDALARCARESASQNTGRGLIFLVVVMPPGDPADAIETLARIRYGGGPGLGLLDEVLSASEDFRGLYTAGALFDARKGRPQAGVKVTAEEDELKLALAFQMVGDCTEADLQSATFPQPDVMSPLVLSCWLRMLARSGLESHVHAALQGLLARSADFRRSGLAAGAWASIAPVADVIAAFGTLPLPAKLAVLDTWWISPREPMTLHPFLLQLAGHDDSTLRQAALHHLGQYRAASTARKLLDSARAHADTAPVAYASLAPMANLLDQGAIASLIKAFAGSPDRARPSLAAVLAATGDKAARDTLLNAWKQRLAFSELTLAASLCARNPGTPAGAWCAAIQAQSRGIEGVSSPAPRRTMRGGEYNHYSPVPNDVTQLAMLRQLLSTDESAGFTLLQSIAADVGDSNRLAAMVALALAGRDEPLIADWLRRLSGEVPDPLGQTIGWAVSMSLTANAQEFRRTVLQQGLRSPHLNWLILSVLAGRAPETKATDLFRVLLESSEGARRHKLAWRWPAAEWPEGTAHNLATALFADGMPNDPALALWIRQSGVDVLKVLYGSAENPVPRDQGQAMATALLGEPQRARTIVGAIEQPDDGSMWTASKLGMAFLGMLDEKESRRLVRAVSGDAGNLWGAARAAKQADAGDALALRELLDRLGPSQSLFRRGGTAGAHMNENRYGSGSLSAQGAAAALYTSNADQPALPVALVKRWLPNAREEWGEWWSSRRALLHWDGKTFGFVDLP